MTCEFHQETARDLYRHYVTGHLEFASAGLITVSEATLISGRVGNITNNSTLTTLTVTLTKQ